MLKIDFSYKNLVIFLGIASFLALFSAYIAEYVFNLKPCILCLYQRKPFFAILVLTIATLLISNKKYQKLLFFACTILLIINALIAIYHVGVEQKIFQGPTSCSGSQDLNSITDLKELEKALEKSSIVKCSKPAFTFLKISMAGWNVIFCLFLVIFSYYQLRNNRPQENSSEPQN